MKQMKIRVLTMVMALMVMMVSVVSAQEYWNGDTNYPRAYAKQGVNYYVDLSSAYIADKKEKKFSDGTVLGEYHFKFNYVIASGNDAHITLCDNLMVVHDEGGSIYYSKDDNGKRTMLRGEFGYEMLAYNAVKIVDKHLLSNKYYFN